MNHLKTSQKHDETINIWTFSFYYYYYYFFGGGGCCGKIALQASTQIPPKSVSLKIFRTMSCRSYRTEWSCCRWSFLSSKEDVDFNRWHSCIRSCMYERVIGVELKVLVVAGLRRLPHCGRQNSIRCFNCGRLRHKARVKNDQKHKSRGPALRQDPPWFEFLVIFNFFAS